MFYVGMPFLMRDLITWLLAKESRWKLAVWGGFAYGGAIGDFSLTLPAIRLIRESLPGCHLEVLGYPGIIDLAVKAGLADAARSLEHRTMALLFAKNATIDEALVEYLCGFNLVVSYLFDPDGYFRSSLERVGVKTLIECPHRIQPGGGHAAAQLAKPLEAL
eukprot:gene15982-19523_t